MGTTIGMSVLGNPSLVSVSMFICVVFICLTVLRSLIVMYESSGDSFSIDISSLAYLMFQCFLLIIPIVIYIFLVVFMSHSCDCIIMFHSCDFGNILYVCAFFGIIIIVMFLLQVLLHHSCNLCSGLLSSFIMLPFLFVNMIPLYFYLHWPIDV